MTHHSRSYVICTTSRSGSTLLCRLLAQTGQAGHPASFFHRPDLRDWAQKAGLEAGATQDTPEGLRQIFDGIRTAGAGNTGVFGLHLMRKSYPKLAEQLAKAFPNAATERARLSAAFGDLLYIRLTRGDKIAQAVSWVRAQQSGLWHRHADGSELERTAPPGLLHYDAEAIGAQRNSLMRDDAAWERWFEREQITPLKLTYEGLAEAPQTCVDRILRRLHGASVPSATGSITPDVRPLSDEISQEWIARFRASDSHQSDLNQPQT